ncbi:MAG: Uma2 family endonuclease [Armatimonadota bacterium]|nr:Uma2 family endonuclease [Armatimonadota bacterium]
MSIKPRSTAEDLWRRGETDGRLELVDGEVVEMPPVGGVHGKVVGRLHRRLAEYMEERGSGEVVVGEVGFILALPYDPERVRAPDIAFIAAERLPDGRLPAGFVQGAPDLAVEVLSPSDSPIDVQQRVRDWLEGGARLVWVVTPQAATATVYRADGSARLLREGDTLEGEDVLPGLRIPLGWVFG